MVGANGSAFMVVGDFQEVIQLEQGLNSGLPAASMAAIDSNAAGLVVAVGAAGYASYSTAFGVLGSWLPLPRDVGLGVNVSPSAVAVSDAGYIVVASRINGAASWAHVSDLTNWTLLQPYLNSGQPIGNLLVNLAVDGNTFVVAYEGGYASISPPLA